MDAILPHLFEIGIIVAIIAGVIYLKHNPNAATTLKTDFQKVETQVVMGAAPTVIGALDAMETWLKAELVRVQAAKTAATIQAPAPNPPKA